MIIRLIHAGSVVPSDPLEVLGVPRAGDYVRVDEEHAYVVLFASYVVGQEAIDIHVTPAVETEVQYATRLSALL